MAEFLDVGHAVVGLVGGGEARELVGMGHPVEVARINDGAAHCGAVAIHVLGGGVGHDVGAPLEGTAVDRRGERVVHDQRHAVGVSRSGEAFDIEDRECRVGDGLAEHALGVGSERRLEFFVARVRRHEGALQAHAAHGVGEQVVGAAVDGGACHHVVSRAGDVEDGEEVRRLAGARQHGGGTALEFGDLCGHVVVRWVLQAGVEVTRLLEIEQAAHMLGGVVLPRGGLVDRHLAGLSVPGTVAALHAGRSDMLGHGLSFARIDTASSRIVSQIGKMVYRSPQTRRKNHGNQ